MAAEAMQMSKNVSELHQALANESTQLSSENGDLKDYERYILLLRSIENLEFDDLYTIFFEYLRFGLSLNVNVGFSDDELFEREETYERLSILEENRNITDRQSQLLRETSSTIRSYVLAVFYQILSRETVETEASHS